jgi:hypothetical protein
MQTVLFDSMTSTNLPRRLPQRYCDMSESHTPITVEQRYRAGGGKVGRERNGTAKKEKTLVLDTLCIGDRLTPLDSAITGHCHLVTMYVMSCHLQNFLMILTQPIWNYSYTIYKS